MCRWVKFLLVYFLIAAAAGCAQSNKAVKRPVQPISSLATKRGAQENALLRGTKNVLQGIGKGTFWVVKELFSPLEALRKGLIHTFGVTSEEVVVERNLPPKGFRPAQ